MKRKILQRNILTRPRLWAFSVVTADNPFNKRVSVLLLKLAALGIDHYRDAVTTFGSHPLDVTMQSWLTVRHGRP